MHKTQAPVARTRRRAPSFRLCAPHSLACITFYTFSGSCHRLDALEVAISRLWTVSSAETCHCTARLGTGVGHSRLAGHDANAAPNYYTLQSVCAHARTNDHTTKWKIVHASAHTWEC